MARSVFKAGLIFIFGTTLTSALNYFYQILMGRMLGPADYGILGSLFAILYLIQISAGSIMKTASKFSAKYKTIRDNEKLSSLYSFSFKSLLIIGIVLLGIFVLLLPFLSSSMGIKDQLSIFLVGIMGFFTLYTGLNAGFLNGLQRFIKQVSVSIVSAVLKLTFGVVLVLLGLGVRGAIFGVIVGMSIGFLLGIYFLRRIIFSKKDEFTEKKQVGRFLLPAFSSNFLAALMISIDLILVKIFFTSTQAGFYAAAGMMGKIIWFGSGVFVNVLYPKFSENHASGKNSAGILKKGLIYTGILAFSGVLAYFVAPNFLVNLVYGPEYKIYDLIGYFGLAMAFYSLNLVMLHHDLARHKYKFIYAMVIAVALEVTMIAFIHNTLLEVTKILFGVNLLLFLYFMVENKKEFGLQDV